MKKKKKEEEERLTGKGDKGRSGTKCCCIAAILIAVFVLLVIIITIPLVVALGAEDSTDDINDSFIPPIPPTKNTVANQNIWETHEMKVTTLGTRVKVRYQLWTEAEDAQGPDFTVMKDPEIRLITTVKFADKPMSFYPGMRVQPCV